MDMFGGMNHAEVGANWFRSHDFPHALVEAVADHESPTRISSRAVLSHALVSTNHLVKQIGIGYSGNSMLDPRKWELLPSTRIIWEARGNKEYSFAEFTEGIPEQFQFFPDLL
jgi:hypothetical protein